MELEKDLLFSEYLEKHFERDIIDFSIRIYKEDEKLKFYIHPSHAEGETRDYRINQEFEAGYDMGVLARNLSTHESKHEVRPHERIVMPKIAELIEYLRVESEEPLLTLKALPKLEAANIEALNNHKKMMKKKLLEWMKMLSNFTA